MNSPEQPSGGMQAGGMKDSSLVPVATERESGDAGSAASFERYRAPRGHGDALIQPPLSTVPQLFASNTTRLAACDDSWEPLRREARGWLIIAAVRSTGRYRDTSWVSQRDSAKVVMSGHQPTLFHPGVWFKNFSLDRVGRDLSAVPINIVVDNDVSDSATVGVPVRDPVSGLFHTAAVAFDTFGGGLPYEQALIQDREVFAGFAESLVDAARPVATDPCVQELWPHVMAAADRFPLLGRAIAEGRHAFEGDIGLQTLELPLSEIASTRFFGAFVFRLLSDPAGLQRAYNESADLYRSAHGIRSAAHPVPNLADVDGWNEVPLWVYCDDHPNRHPVWAQQRGAELVLSDRQGLDVAMSTESEQAFGADWSRVCASGIKLRPRALVTTMFLRCVMSDLFLHGIGGGKYDQLGDLIAARVLGVEPPQFMVLSSTVHLASGDGRDYAEEIRQARLKIRQSIFNPELLLDQSCEGRDDIAELVDRKRLLLTDMPPRGQRLPWHTEITKINRQLSGELELKRASLAAEIGELSAARKSQALLCSRELSFCLYDLGKLVSELQGMLSLD